MGFDPAQLNVLVDSIGGGALRIHHYDAGTATPEEVEAPGYIVDARKRGMRVDDMVILTISGANFLAIVTAVAKSGAGTIKIEDTDEIEADVQSKASRSANLSDLSNKPQALTNIGGLSKGANLSDLADLDLALDNLQIEKGATKNTKALSADVITGTDDAKFITVVRGAQQVKSRAAKADFTPAMPSSFVRSLDERLLDDADSILDLMDATVRNQVRDGVPLDISPYINDALSKSIDIYFPGRIGVQRVTTYIQQSGVASRVRFGEGASLKFDPAAGSPTAPVWIVLPSAVGAQVIDPVFDHNAGGPSGTQYNRFVAPTLGGGDLGWGSAFVVQADDAYIHRPKVKNAWDNGIGLGAFSLTVKGDISPGRPQDVVVYQSRTKNCGIGIHPEGEQAGGGVNLLMASRAQIIGGKDLSSFVGFLSDVGAGAGGVFAYCEGITNFASTHQGTPVGGHAFYILSTDVELLFPIARLSQRKGIVLDGYARNCSVIRSKTVATRQEGIWLQGKNNRILYPIIELASYENQGLYPAILMEGVADQGGGVFGDSTGNIVVEPQTSGTYHKHGIQAEGGVGVVKARVIGGDLNGTISPFKSVFPTVQSSKYTTSFTPSLNSGVTVTSPDCEYRIVEGVLFVTWRFNLTSAPANLSINLPAGFVAAKDAVFWGTNINTTGALAGYVSAGTAFASVTPDPGQPFASGHRVIIEARVQIA